MIYREIFSRSWKYLWQSKLLWLFGALAVIPSWIIDEIRFNVQP